MNACHRSENSSSSLLTRGVRRRLMRCAKCRHDWSLTELAAVAGLSSRTLQRRLGVFLGKSPA